MKHELPKLSYEYNALEPYIDDPRIILPMSVALTNLINMLLTFIIVFIALIFFGGFFVWKGYSEQDYCHFG